MQGICERPLGPTRLLLVMAALTLAGCVAVPPRQAFNHDAHPHVETIHVLPMVAGELDIFVQHNPGYSFGLIGTAIAEADRTGKRRKLEALAQRHGLDLEVELRTQLESAFAKRGYTLSFESTFFEPKRISQARAQRAPRRDTGGMRKAYGNSNGAQAQLDLNLKFAGYAAAGMGKANPYRPTVHLWARLVDTNGSSILFFDRILYHALESQSNAITLNPAPEYAYPTFSDIENAEAEAIAGLRRAIADVAQQLAAQF